MWRNTHFGAALGLGAGFSFKFVSDSVLPSLSPRNSDSSSELERSASESELIMVLTLADEMTQMYYFTRGNMQPSFFFSILAAVIKKKDLNKTKQIVRLPVGRLQITSVFWACLPTTHLFCQDSCVIKIKNLISLVASFLLFLEKHCENLLKR